MKTLLCPQCWRNHKKNGWYISSSYKRTANVPDCEFHPTLTNWRAVRTLKTLRLWSLNGADYRHSNCKAVRLTLSGGLIHRRTAEAILFDYEKPFIDLLIKEGYLKQHKNHDGVARALEVMPKSDEFLRANLKAELV